MSTKCLATALIACATLAGPAAATELTVATGGGIILDAERSAFFEPTTKALGFKFKEENIQNVRDIRIQVQSHAVTWDLAQLGLDECQIAVKEGLLEKIDHAIVKTDGISSPSDMDYCIPAYYYSTVMAWNTKTGKPMKSWADFFDTKAFPGSRALFKYPRGNIEAALLADGVAPDKLYPLDVDRAFRKLEQIKPEIQAWWDSGAQSAQLLKDGEVDYIQIWNGRASSVIRDGGKAAFSYDQGILTGDAFVIPKGAPHKAEAMKALAMFFAPAQQARFPLTVDYGPSNQKAFEVGLLTPEQIARINTSPDNMKRQVKMDEAWWAEHTIAVMERWDNFMQR